MALLTQEMSLSKLQEIMKDWEAWHAALHGVAESDMTWLLNSNSYGSYIEINKLTVKFKLKCKQSRISKAILKKIKKLLKDLLIDFNTNFKAIIIHMV